MPQIMRCTVPAGRPARLLWPPTAAVLDVPSMNAQRLIGTKEVVYSPFGYDAQMAQVVRALDDADVVAAVEALDVTP